MKIQTPASSEETRRHRPSSTQTAQRSENRTGRKDERPEAAQLKAMQSLASVSPPNQSMLALHAKMNASATVQKQRARQADLRQNVQLQAQPEAHEPRRMKITESIPRLEDNAKRTGLPDQLKSAVESPSRMAVPDVRAHGNADKPAQLDAVASTQGRAIGFRPGREQSGQHETWQALYQQPERAGKTLPMQGGPTARAPQSVTLGQVRALADRGAGAPVIADPQAATYDDLREHCAYDPNAPAMVLGYTQAPRGYRVPTYSIQMIPPVGDAPWHQWSAIVTQTQAADEGNALSFFAAPGMYDTKAKYNGRPVYIVVSQAISSQAEAGELEHVNDHRRAFQLTLGAAQIAIQTLAAAAPVIADTPEGGTGTTEESARDLLLARSFPRQIGFKPENWGHLYANLSEKTRQRDINLWHTFALGGLVDAAGPIWTRTVTEGSTHIGHTNSADLVRFE